MRYKSFRIRNFKGIKDTKVDLSSLTGANVFSLVGLNESGKTTLLEAIHSFSPDYRTSQIISQDYAGDDFEKLVPRHEYSLFNGDISVESELIVAEEDKRFIARHLIDDCDLKIDVDSISELETVTKIWNFRRGNYQRTFRTASGDFRVKGRSARNWREPTNQEREEIGNAFWLRTPNIAYYPTFIFEFPDKIWLTDRGDTISRFYREVFEDILDFDGQGLNIQEDIIDRVRSEDFLIPWLDFAAKWREDANRAKVRHVIDRAQRSVTSAVFGKWDKIFKEDAGGKEIYIDYEVDEGKIKGSDGRTESTNRHDIYIKFQIKDGTRRFDVNDRSLGFRWFFSFLLLTQFRVAGNDNLPTLFLFDEPASNLHAAAQQKLIEGFNEIAKNDNMLLYSTHSHYMIEPKWLGQTFIVSNRSEKNEQNIVDTAVLDDESLDIQATRYRSFVQSASDKTSYFQPIIDRLDVVPSKFDYNIPSVVLEGKSDYYILRYAEKLFGTEEIRLIPGLGAGTFAALISLSIGWGIRFIFVLDGDAKGEEERLRYASEHGISPERLISIRDLDETLCEIEDLFDDEARGIIAKAIGITDGVVGKKSILRFCQEQLAKDHVLALGGAFESKATAVLAALKERLALS